MSSPYEAPKSTHIDTKTAEPPSGKSAGLAIVSSLLASLILVGLAIFVFQVFQTFESVILTETGDPKLLAGQVAQALMPLVLLGLVSTVGLFFMLLIVLFTPYRKKWFFRTSLVLSVLHLLYVPIGTVVALIYLVVLFRKRREFGSREANTVHTVSDV